MKWLEDEKEARSYLHSLASNMQLELDQMKTATIRVRSRGHIRSHIQGRIQGHIQGQIRGHIQGHKHRIFLGI